MTKHLKLLILLPLLLLAGQAGANPHFMAVSGPQGGSACGTLVEDYSTQDADFGCFKEAARKYCSVQWLSGSEYTLCAVAVYIKRVLNIDTTLTAYIYDDSGGDAPNASQGTSTNTVGTLSIDTNYEWVFFYFAGVSISNATKYHVVLKVDAVGDASNFMRWGYDSTESTRSKYYDDDGVAPWTSFGADQGCMRTYK